MDNLQILLDAPIFSVQLLIDGLLVGAIFALVAYGMALVWGVMNIINICQGEYVMLGGFITYLLFSWGISPFVGIPVAFVVLYLVGWLTYRVVICRVAIKNRYM